MKSSILIQALFVLGMTADAKLANAPKLLRANKDEQQEWGRHSTTPRQRTATRDNGGHRALDSSSSSSAMSMPPIDEIEVVQWSSYALSSTCELKYRVNVPSDTNEEECIGCSVSMEVIHDGEAWLGIAFSTNGRMVGSEAVIGTPGDTLEDGLVQKYDLNSKWSSRALRAMDAQTLTEASIEVVDGQTIMKFTKLLKEPGEIEILPTGDNILLYARGYGPSLGYHAKRKSFGLNLM